MHPAACSEICRGFMQPPTRPAEVQPPQRLYAASTEVYIGCTPCRLQTNVILF